MAVHLPGGLQSLLAKLGIGGNKAAGPLGNAAKGQEEAKAGPQKGDSMGPEGALLVGLGFSSADKAKGKMNAAEKENVARFLQEGVKEPVETKEARSAFGEGGASFDQAGKAEARDRPAREEVAKERDGPSAQDAKETRRDERAEDSRHAAQKEGPERKEVHEAREAKDRREEREDDGRDRSGGGGGHGGGDSEDDENPEGYRDAEVFSDGLRCHGTGLEGERCLRRALDGQPYCREHVAVHSTKR